ncbi:MAG: PAS domain S-box protein [Candidatus Lokiarchaeota archaeon]|nr:PAS domain S-box protein [Candidatus Lokiarchaeota archaeon]
MESIINDPFDDEKFVSKLVLSIGDWIWYVDRKGIIRFCSPDIKTILNYSVNQIIGKPLKEYIVNAVDNDLLFKFEATENKSMKEIKVQLFHNNGTLINVKMYIIPFFSEDGTYRGFTGINRMCTNIIEKEKSPKEDPIQDILMRNVDNLIFVINPKNNYKIQNINENQFYNQLHYSSADLLGKNIENIIHPEDRIKIINIFDNNRTIDSKSKKIRIKNKKKKYIWFKIVNLEKTIYNNSETIFLLLKNISKIKKLKKEIEETQERLDWLYNEVPEIRYWKLLMPKKAITAVQKSQEMLEKVIDNIPQYIFWKDKDLKYLGCNYNFANLIGIDNPDKISGMTNKKIPFFKNNLINNEILEKEIIKIKQPHLNNIEFATLSKGKKVIFNINRIPISDDNDNVVGLLSTYEDITSRKISEEQLKASEEKYRNILENIKESYFETDLVGNITFTNDAFCEATGYSKEELKGMNFSNFCDKKNNEKLHKAFNRVYKEEIGIRNLQYKGRFKENKEDVIESSAYLMKGPAGNKTGFAGLIRIITEKYNLQEKLKESEYKYRLISENANDFISIINEKLEYEYINEKPHLKGLGYTKEELVGKNCKEIIHPNDLEKSMKTLSRGFLNKEPGSAEVRIKHKNGHWIWVDVKGTPFLDNDNKIKAVLMARDINERKETEEKLKQSEEKLRKLNKLLEKKILERTRELRISEEKFRTITELSLLGVAILQDFKVLYANNALSQMIGYSEDELKSWEVKDLIKCFHPPDINSIPMMIKDIENLEIGNVLEYTLKVLTKNKKTKYLVIYLRRIPYKGSSAISFSAVDITVKKQTEIQLIESERKLKEQNQELKKLDKLKTDFITMAAHELKTPLYCISGYIDLMMLRETDLKNEIKDELKIIYNNSKRLESYVNKLLDALKIDAKKMDLRMNKIRISEILNRCILDLKYHIKKKNIEIKLEIDNSLKLNIDPFRITQVFSNLISNALKFTPSNCAIHISDEKINNKMIYKIRDNGIGLTKEEIEKLFGKFIMLNNDIEYFSNGSGLGLYISKGIIEAHGGEIWVESEGKDKGSTFNFSLPL